MKEVIDYYETLGVSYYSTADEIKEAYKRRVKEVHPDKQQDNESEFMAVKEAYDILGNEEKRKLYNDILFKVKSFNVQSFGSQYEPKKDHSSRQDGKINGGNKWRILAVTMSMLSVASFAFVGWIYLYYEAQIAEVQSERSSLMEKLSASENDNSVLDSRLGEVIQDNISLTEENAEIKSDLANVSLVQEEYSDVSASNSAVDETSNIIEEYEDAFTLGSSKEHVKSIMGTPSRLWQSPLGGEYWWYGTFSRVNFDSDGRVEGWNDSEGILKVK
ncbi:DnaJ domain-containing protein [Bacillus infantis]|uniref:DnaJ domain-containing protein n=1 Tax=Bacillus infantis TaxID=324767 RepID=UPI0021555ABE|nr:DnaJ domain-containing protein [Bacillus infantis]MCR6610599.1 DnaJ domain-containing protein [Bacillus infantis]